MVLALAIRLADRGFCMGGADTDDTTNRRVYRRIRRTILGHNEISLD